MFTDAAAESVLIDTSMSLKSGNATHYMVNFVTVADPGDPSTPIPAMFVTVAGINVAHLGVFFNNASGSAINLRNIIGRGSPGQGATISVDIETSASVTVENSVAKSVGAFGDALGLLGVPNGGQIDFRIVGNRFDGNGNNQSGDGISLHALSSGNLKADVYNNTVWDVARNGFAGIFISASGTVQADINVVGNTIEESGADGLQPRNLLSSGGSFALDMFNNDFSHAGAFGVRLDNGSAVATTFRAGFNNYFANASGNRRDGLSLGANNLSADPKFVDRANGNLRLKSTSKLINTGQVCSPGGVTNPDAANRGRLNGSSVDIGAYERGAGTINGLVFLGTSGPDTQTGSPGADIMCGYSGMDIQNGNGGNDFMDGGDDADVLLGGLGADRMLGGLGPDTLCANDGKNIDFLNGGGGTDGFKADPGDTRQSVEQAASCL
jgi:hypothetical protein